MLYLTCIMISSVDLAHYGVSRAKDWVSVDCGNGIKEFIRQRYVDHQSLASPAYPIFLFCHDVMGKRDFECFVTQINRNDI